MENLNDNKDYGDEEIRSIQQHYANDIDESIIHEWKTFRTYLLAKNQLTIQHVDQLMRISIEGEDTLNEEIKEEIINYWKKLKPRRLAV
ncbi:unnamed protein product [Rotaria sp. Silwood2]|nr:unnamed protein product [Rotaria sp. Silwood2]